MATNQEKVINLLKNAPHGMTRAELQRKTHLDQMGLKNAVKRLRESGYKIAYTKAKEYDDCTFKLESTIKRTDKVRNAGLDRERVYNFICRQTSPVSTRKIAEALKMDRPRLANFLQHLQATGLVRNQSTGKSMGEWVPCEKKTVPASSRHPICTGTMKEPLDVGSLWPTPYRAGANDASLIRSRGIGQ